MTGRHVLTLAALLAVGCGQSDKSLREALPRGRKGPPLKVDPALVPEPSPVLSARPEGMVAALRGAYRLTPDRRLTGALDELQRLLGVEGGRAGATFENERWRVVAGPAFSADLPAYPGFPQLLEVAVARARALGVVRGRDPSSTDSGRFLLDGALADLRKAEAGWKSRSKVAAALAGARAVSRIGLQTWDDLELADVLYARGLALLAIVRAGSPSAGLREEAMLALSMGYGRHAESLGRALTARDPLRLLLTNDVSALQAMARHDSPEEVRALRILQVARSGDPLALAAEIRRLFPGKPPLGVVRAAAEMPAVGQDEAVGVEAETRRAFREAILREVGASAEPDLDASVRRRMEQATGPLLTPDVVEAVFRAPWHTASWKEEGHGSSALRPPKGFHDLRRGDADAFRQVLAGGDQAGGAPIARALYWTMGSIDWMSPDRPELVRRAARRLDTRPRHRRLLSELVRYFLFDNRFGEELSRSYLETVGIESAPDAGREAVYVRDWDRCREILDSPAVGANPASAILFRWDWTKAAPEELKKRFEALLLRFPNDWGPVNAYVSFLRRIRNFDRDVGILEEWRARVTDPTVPGVFHSHVRLGYSYFLAGRHQKALDFLSPFDDAFAGRARAFALRGLGRMDEAEREARAAATANGDGDRETMSALATVLLSAGKIREAAEVFDRANTRAEGWDRFESNRNFADFFGSTAPSEAGKFIVALRERKWERGKLFLVAQALADGGRPEAAIAALEKIEPPGSADFDLVLKEYGFRKGLQGEDAAVAWINKLVPPERRNALSIKAVFDERWEVLWRVIENVNPKDRPETVWLLRAAAFARQGGKGQHEAELRKHFEGPPRDMDHVIGRYLCGLEDDKTVLALATDASKRAQVANYMAMKAHGEQRLAEASDLYRVSMETNVGHDMARGIAGSVLGHRFNETQGGISAIAAEQRSH